MYRPKPEVAVDPDIRGGYPVIAGTRVPYDLIAGLLEDGVSAEDVAGFSPPLARTLHGEHSRSRAMSMATGNRQAPDPAPVSDKVRCINCQLPSWPRAVGLAHRPGLVRAAGSSWGVAQPGGYAGTAVRGIPRGERRDAAGAPGSATSAKSIAAGLGRPTSRPRGRRYRRCRVSVP
jgi:hypothetical protein